MTDEQKPYPTVTERQNACFTGEWAFDGHGINRGGDRILTLTTEPYLYDSGKPVRNEAHERIGEQVASFCEEAHRLMIVSHTKKPSGVVRDQPTHDELPRMFLTVNLDEVTERGAAPDTVLTIEVRRKDGKIARFHVALVGKENEQKVALRVSTQRLNDDPVKVIPGHFVDFNEMG
jgi:hypothetical protein